jgi:hypothetical protein
MSQISRLIVGAVLVSNRAALVFYGLRMRLSARTQTAG